MFIQNLQIDRFGAVVNLAVDNLTQDITVIQGDAGTGKRTLLHFARAILYGFDETTRTRYLPPVSSNEFGGSITWSRGHHQYTVRRHDDGKFNGHFKVTDDGHPGSRVVLTDALSGISADLYSRLFAVDFSRRPDVSGLIDEAANCGYSIEGRVIDTVKLEELKRRLTTYQATLATLASVDESSETLQSRRRELLADIARLELDVARRRDERAGAEGRIEAIQRQLETSRQELHALRKAMDEITAIRQDCLSRLEKAEAAATNYRTHETEILELDAQIERWKGLLREAAARHEALGMQGSVTPSPAPHVDEFQANLVALDTYLRELELTASPDPVGVQRWENPDYAPKLQAMRDRLTRLRNQVGVGSRSNTKKHCDCERKQLTRTQAELQVSLRYLEDERDALLADSRPSQELTDEIARLKRQLEQVEAKQQELQQRFETLTLAIRQKESDLGTLQKRSQGTESDLTERLEQHRRELQHIEYQLNEFERRQTLLESIAETQRQIRSIEDGSESSILRAATNYLRRVSGSDFERIEVAHGKHVWVADAKGHRLSWGHLSESVRDKVYLSLCLALVEAHDQRNSPLPLIWKDLFTNFDSRQVPEAAELLCNFARHGRQILLLTRHEHVASVFRLKHVPLRKLVATHNCETTTVGSRQERNALDVNQMLTAAGEAESNDVDLHWQPDQELEVNRDYFLHDDSPIEQSPSLSSDNVVRLRRLGITTVGDLLEVSADEIASDLSYAGISSRMVSDWQSQALLMCHVPRLREYDARILVACGITGPNQLRQIPPIEVRSMIERFAESSEGRAMLLSGTEFELSRVTDWVRTEECENEHRHQRALNESRMNSRESSAGGGRGRSGESTGRSAKRASNGTGRRSNRSNRSADGTSNRTTRRSALGSRAPRHYEQRTGYRGELAEQQVDVVQMTSPSEPGGLRFYLESDAGVVDAPSIGPRSAERLEAVGVVTVSDFLAADADEVAKRLNYKRMSAKMLREWQQQTTLVCRVPQLRGHDAQILVGVGVTDVEELAGMDAQELWSLVEPFINSTAGKRIVRSSKAPDFEEVFHWIEWANQARVLKVA